MAYVTYKNRTSENYRFTTTDINDPAIAELKAILVEQNNHIKRARKLYGFLSYWGSKPTRGLSIRPRGPRKNSWAYDTPKENATHFDVYIRDYS